MAGEVLMSRLIVVDTETTGPDLFRHDILSYAFVPMNDAEVLEGFVKGVGELTWSDVARSYFESTYDRWAEEAKTPLDAVSEIEAYLDRIGGGSELIMVGHNVAFDRYFLQKLAHDAGKSSIRGLSHRSVDTHSLLVALSLMGRIPEAAVNSSGAFKYFGVEPRADLRHTARGDALATRDLFKLVLEELRSAHVPPEDASH